ncbi:MAG TPA: hypothetical protein VGP99_11430 [Tepidisphaeraceae bacterium]|jgi:hypothetical protein|nr:hypothetical protein [Tepidisphaeraceae bacterium]
MPIRAQCDNCGKVYNLPDESAGKRLRCKQCAVAFTVSAAAAPAQAPTVGPQKICVVCGQNVAGRPRTKDQAGNYYCRSCYEEKARNRQQLAQSRVGAAVPAGVGAGGGGDDGEMIDLAALEPTEQFDESAQPPPPPIPDMDMVVPPIPDMEGPIMAEPVVIEAPKPRKKKKKKKGAAAVDKTARANTIIAKVLALPAEIWPISIAMMIIVAALVNRHNAPQAVLGLIVLGVLTYLWGHVFTIICAFAEETTTGVRCMLFPVFQLFFVLTNWDVVKRYVGRMGLGIVFVIAGIAIGYKFGKEELDNFEKEFAKIEEKNLSSDPAFKIQVYLENPFDDEETADATTDPATEAREKEIADAILASFHKRGIKPPEGVKYKAQASAEVGEKETELVCHLLVSDSTGADIFQQEKMLELPEQAIKKASKKQKTKGILEDKEVWKKTVGVFSTLADQVPGGTAPTTAPSSGTATPDRNAAPGTGTDASRSATPSGSPAPAK